MNQSRPVNLDLSTMKFPPMAIASILHRIAGIILFLLLPVMLYYLSLSLHSEDSFSELKMMLATPFHKVVLWTFVSAAIYHVLAGVRHLLMDVGYGEGLPAGRRSAIFVIIVAICLIIYAGISIW